MERPPSGRGSPTRSTSHTRREGGSLQGATDAQSTGPARELGLRVSFGHVELGPVLGKGGMGEVRSAEQPSLGREVAVKTMRPDRQDDRTAALLLREAYVIGQLEHPNVVPVHDVVLDHENRPLVVLKKIEGEVWRDLMQRPELIRERFGAEDPEGWNIRVVVQVCQALRYAHSRGIVHRDVKPANVMVGEFGEVYVLDWGVAASLVEDPTERLRWVGEGSIAGTAGYMAPEQRRGAPFAISERTDVYLVGGMLYELVSGRVPHAELPFDRELTPEEHAPEPVSETVSHELRAIIARAMAYDPADRYESVDGLRRDLEAYMAHRGAIELTRSAKQRARDGFAAGGEGDMAAAERMFMEATYGYRTALEIWPDYEEARRGLDELTARRIEHALATGKPAVAERLLSTYEDAPANLRQRVREALTRDATERERLLLLDHEHDPSRGWWGRFVLSIVAGLTWVVGFPVAFAVERSAWPLLVHTGVFLTIGVVATFALRSTLVATQRTRAILGLVFTMGLGQALWLGTGAISGIPFLHLLQGLLVIWTLTIGASIATIETRNWPALVFYAAATAVVAFVPTWAEVAVVVANTVILLNTSWVSRQLARDAAEGRKPG